MMKREPITNSIDSTVIVVGIIMLLPAGGLVMD